MARKVYEETYIANIADKIREKTGGNNTYKTREMPSGVEAVYEKGRQDEYSAFWDILQDSGNRTEYAYAFAYAGWTDENFNPKYDINCIGNNNSSIFRGARIVDIEAALQRSGVVLDTSQATSLNLAFSNRTTEVIPTIDMTSISSDSGANMSFQPELRTIRKIISAATTTWNASTFRYASGLINLIIEGTIAKNNFNVQWSTKLSKASITSIINALSTTTSGLTVTLSQTAVENAFLNISVSEWEELITTKPNWTISLA